MTIHMKKKIIQSCDEILYMVDNYKYWSQQYFIHSRLQSAFHYE